MNSNQKGGQGSKQSEERDTDAERSGKQGGTHEQHVEAGRQSHKNDPNKQSDAGTGSKQSGGAGSGGQQNQSGRPSEKPER